MVLYGTHTFDAELDCDWMTVDVDITFNLSNEGETDIVEAESVIISLSGQDISRFVNWDYIDKLIDEFVSSGWGHTNFKAGVRPCGHSQV